jgi:hypothetical protein
MNKHFIPVQLLRSYQKSIFYISYSCSILSELKTRFYLFRVPNRVKSLF